MLSIYLDSQDSTDCDLRTKSGLECSMARYIPRLESVEVPASRQPRRLDYSRMALVRSTMSGCKFKPRGGRDLTRAEKYLDDDDSKLLNVKFSLQLLRVAPLQGIGRPIIQVLVKPVRRANQAHHPGMTWKFGTGSTATWLAIIAAAATRYCYLAALGPCLPVFSIFA